MFKDVYHEANDDIPVNTELLNNILSAKPKKHKYLYPRFTVAASIFFILAVVLAFPNLVTAPITDDITLTTDELSANQPQPVASSTPFVETKKDSAPTADTHKTDINIDSNIDLHTSSTTPKSTQKTSVSKIPENTQSTICESVSPTKPPLSENKQTSAPTILSEVSEVSSSETPQSEPTQNSVVCTPVSEPQVKGVNSDSVTREELITETWNEDKYFEYLGKKISPSLPEDLIKISDTEKNITLSSKDNTPYYDMWLLKYSSEDASRAASIRISKNSSQAPNVFFLSENHAEIVTAETLITVDSVGLSAEEFELLCSSLK